jgi:hypothetical protein
VGFILHLLMLYFGVLLGKEFAKLYSV